MITRLREAGLLWPAILTIAGLAILISLGNWQMRRLAWKEGLIARMEARANEEPVALDALLREKQAGQPGDIEGLEFHRVRVAGRFQNDKEFHVWSPGKRGPAWSIVTPLELSEPVGEGRRDPLSSVLVIRGTVPDANKAPSTRASGNPEGKVEIIGRVRVGRVGAFSNAESATKNEWYDYDIDAMRKAIANRLFEGSASGTPEAAIATIAPFYVEAETATGRPQGPQPDLGKVNLTSRHLEYALTWYGLAAALLSVYLSFAWSRLRRPV